MECYDIIYYINDFIYTSKWMTVIIFGIVSVDLGLCLLHEAYVTYVMMYLANDITAMTLFVKVCSHSLRSE